MASSSILPFAWRSVFSVLTHSVGILARATEGLSNTPLKSNSKTYIPNIYAQWRFSAEIISRIYTSVSYKLDSSQHIHTLHKKQQGCILFACVYKDALCRYNNLDDSILRPVHHDLRGRESTFKSLQFRSLSCVLLFCLFLFSVLFCFLILSWFICLSLFFIFLFLLEGRRGGGAESCAYSAVYVFLFIKRKRPCGVCRKIKLEKK